MQMRAEISDLVRAINEDSMGIRLQLRDQEFTQLETILGGHPEVWPMGLIDTFKLLQRKLRWESIDKQTIPESLLDFFDEKFRRDLDPMALARNIGQDICSSCGDCECRC
jgi:hypothetical protein